MGNHNILAHTNPQSPTHVRNVPDLCGRCHDEGGVADKRYEGAEHSMVANYKASVHGLALRPADWAGGHRRVHRLPHLARHAAFSSETRQLERAPHEDRRHLRRSATRASTSTFRESRSTSPEQSKDRRGSAADVQRLPQLARNRPHRRRGLQACRSSTPAATAMKRSPRPISRPTTARSSSWATPRPPAACHDCHGQHNVLPVADPKSTLSRDNIVNTCAQCHPAGAPPVRGLPDACDAPQQGQVPDHLTTRGCS